MPMVKTMTITMPIEDTNTRGENAPTVEENPENMPWMPA